MRVCLVFVGLLAGLLLANCSNKPKEGVPDKPTFAEHIAPIIFKNCSPCHRDSGAAPFPLTSYGQVRGKAKTIAKVTEKRYMPPWPADPSYSHFVGEKYLSDAEIATIKRWADQGCAAGKDGIYLQWKAPAWRSNIGKPDMILPLEPVALLPNLQDRFFLVKIPGLLPRDTWVRAIEFVAGEPNLVHHFNGHILMYEPGAKKNHAKPPLNMEITSGEYDSDFIKLDLLNDNDSKPYRLHSAVNYLPGVQATAYPNGIGIFRLTKMFTIVGNDMHYGPGNRKTTDKSYINLFFTDKPPARETRELMLGTNGVSRIAPPLQIEPNTRSRHSTRFQVDADISLLTVNPHLHMLGKSIKGYAIKPNGDTVKLISIPKWDFRWQYFYTFKNPVHLPAGTWIISEAEFDNTLANPNNPNRPPKRVGERLEYGGASMRAGDEMFQFILTYMLYQKGDEKISLETDER
ncbi:MAG: hypothetical protein RLZZ161_1296 [Bacteroidota bacterium]